MLTVFFSLSLSLSLSTDIVSSGIDSSFSTSSPNLVDLSNPYSCSKIDAISVTVVSKKLDPVGVGEAIEHFLEGFLQTLESMPVYEIESHADALSKKLYEPHKKLWSEASEHFAKVRRFAPEVQLNNHMKESGGEGGQGGQGGNGGNLLGAIPWGSTDVLAAAILKVKREDLVNCYKRVVVGETRSRIASFVYGSKFPKVLGKTLGGATAEGGGMAGGGRGGWFGLGMKTGGAGGGGGGGGMARPTALVLEGYEGARNRGKTVQVLDKTTSGGGGGGGGEVRGSSSRKGILGGGGNRLLVGLGVGVAVGGFVALGLWAKKRGEKGGELPWSIAGVKKTAVWEQGEKK